MKTLFFERAGMALNDMNDVGTGRIRTAFHTTDGNRYYLEMIAIRKSKQTSWCEWERTGFVDCCYLMDGDEITRHYIQHPQFIKSNPKRFEWTLTNILNLVNSFGGDFDAVRIADPTEYRVFQDSDGHRCNFGDEVKE